MRRSVTVADPLKTIWIGFDPREVSAFAVAVQSIRSRLTGLVDIRAIELQQLRDRGWYTRKTETRNGRLFDVVSNHVMSTEFAISRFLTPLLARHGWALFVDCDVMALCDLMDLFDLADDRYAVMCVKHNHVPSNVVKMDDQVQTFYDRKNWSSVCLYNCGHPSNRSLTPKVVNEQTGLFLHGFGWLKDDEIGELPQEYNYLVGHSLCTGSPKLVHFTDGTPNTPGYEDCEFNSLWRHELRKAAHNIF